MGMMINRRRVCGGKSLPYDAEVAYIQSSGTQFIDTGFIMDNTVESIYVRFHQTADDDIKFLFGNRFIENAFCIFAVKTGRLIAYFFGTGEHRLNYSSLMNKTLEFTYDGSKCTLLDTSSGTEYSFTPTITENESLSFKLFGNTPNFTTYRSQFRFYEAHIIMPNTELHVVPVRVGQVGYMYDKVSKQLFGNVGTGSFILGPDK